MVNPTSTLTRAAFAARAGVSRPAITQACRPGGPLEPACVEGGIDCTHSAAVSYLFRADGKLLAPSLFPDDIERIARRVVELWLDATKEQHV